MTDGIAVTVIGGYLGSGKTTLVNHILSTATERIAVLVNDFGDINVDADLIQSRDDDTIELSNGCICCSLVDGFSAALDQVRALDPPPSRLVIEASGVSDPAAVAAFGHGPGLLLDGVIGLVDAETIRAQATDKYIGQLVTQQLAAAQILVLNKIDLVDDATAAQTRAWLEQQSPDAFVVTTTDSDVPPELLFGRTPIDPSAPTDQPDHSHSTMPAFRTWTVERSEPMDRSELDALMAELGDDVARAKGLVWLTEGPDRPAVLQRVGRRWTVRRFPAWPAEPATRIVVIAVAT